MKIILTGDKNTIGDLYVEADLTCPINETIISTEHNSTMKKVKIVAGCWTGSEHGEEVLRKSVRNIVNYATQNNYKKIVFLADTFIENSSDTAFLTNILLEEFSAINNTDNITVIIKFVQFQANEELLYEFNKELAKPIIETVNQSYGDCGDPLKGEFEQYVKSLSREKMFREYLVDLMNQKGIRKSSEVYRASGVSKFTFSKIINFSINPPHKPSKETVAALTIGLKLNLKEAEEFYSIAGYHLGKTEFIDKAVRFFIQKGIYKIYDVNYCLMDNGYPPLGEKPREGKIDIKFR